MEICPRIRYMDREGGGIIGGETRFVRTADADADVDSRAKWAARIQSANAKLV